MKSVVVEASTVAKAIEIAWLKADRPEEFFIRVLQEHSSGFLGFGAQKAKVVFFFKNSQKSDSLFPVVVKQKEYSSFFGNFNLKVPTEMNVVDNELNKNVSLGGQQHKKKPHNNNQNNQKPKHSNQQSDVRPRSNNNSSYVKPAPHPVLNKIAQERDAIIAERALQGQTVKQIKIQPSAVKVSADTKSSVDGVAHKNAQAAPKMQVTMQAPVVKATVDNKAPVHKKEDVAKDIAKVLKKVQTQKVVANVSSSFAKATQPTHKASAGTAADKPVDAMAGKKMAPKSTAKFESYEDFINSTTGIPAEKESIVAQVTPNVSIVEKIESLQKNLETHKVLENSAVSDFSQREVVKQDVAQEVTAKVAAPRTPLKFKRRPLTTENPGVSGIVRSSVANPIEEIEKTSGIATADADKSE